MHHTHELPNSEEDVKLIGVYSSNAEAELAVKRASCLPGFKESPDGFSVSECTIDEDDWKEGFFTWRPDTDD